MKLRKVGRFILPCVFIGLERNWALRSGFKPKSVQKGHAFQKARRGPLQKVPGARLKTSGSALAAAPGVVAQAFQHPQSADRLRVARSVRRQLVSTFSLSPRKHLYSLWQDVPGFAAPTNQLKI